MDEDLAQAWERLAGELAARAGWATAVGAELTRRYTEPHRAYHTLEHIREVLETVDALTAAGEAIGDPAAVRLAAWFHDAVYEPGARGNERASADLAVAALSPLGLAPARVAAIAELITDTADHVPRSADARVLIDADLAILAAGPGRYARYVRDVRAEYAAVPDPRWRAGRGAVLETLLARSPLYTTATMRARAETAARRNLIRERSAQLQP